MRSIANVSVQDNNKYSRQFDLVICAVSLAFGHDREQLIVKDRRGGQSIVAARQIAIYLCRTVYGLSYRQIGNLFFRDRTTIAHSCLVVEQMRDDTNLDRRLNQLEDVLRSELFETAKVEGMPDDFAA